MRRIGVFLFVAVVAVVARVAPGAARAAEAGEQFPPLPAAGTQPLIDRALVERLAGSAALVLHPPQRRAVVLTLDRPWEGKMSGYGTVLRGADGKVRLYYRGGGDIDPPEVNCVAISDDGVSFVRPSLGLYDVRGTRENNVVYTAAPGRPSYGESHNFSPFLDANPAAPADARWKAVALRTDKDDRGERRRMLTVLGSPDGLRWRHLADRPVIREGSFDSLNVAFFDPAGGGYACYFRVGRDGMRSFARAHSKDFLAWTIDTRPLEFRPPQDEQWYTNGVCRYPGGPPGLYLALPMRFVPQRKSVGHPPRPTDGLSDAVLMSSRDGGRSWDRTFREAFLRPGPDPANWGDAHGNNTPLAGGPVETAPGEWSLYWFEGGATGGPPRVRRGTVRAHGLASVHAGADGGEFVTAPLRLPRDRPAALRINYATSAVGSVRVEVLGADGAPLAGFAAGDCAEIYGDELTRPVAWRGGRDLPAGRPFRLRFVLRDADVYALAFP